MTSLEVMSGHLLVSGWPAAAPEPPESLLELSLPHAASRPGANATPVIAAARLNRARRVSAASSDMHLSLLRDPQRPRRYDVVRAASTPDSSVEPPIRRRNACAYGAD